VDEVTKRKEGAVNFYSNGVISINITLPNGTLATSGRFPKGLVWTIKTDCMEIWTIVSGNPIINGHRYETGSVLHLPAGKIRIECPESDIAYFCEYEKK
jgi:hypothetical protein